MLTAKRSRRCGSAGFGRLTGRTITAPTFLRRWPARSRAAAPAGPVDPGVEQVSGRSRERLAERVLALSRRFADEERVARQPSAGEHDLRASRGERAALAVAPLLRVQLVQRCHGCSFGI